MTFILFVLVLVGAIWGLAYVQRGSMLAGCVAVVLVGYCCGHHLVNFDLGPLPLTVDRLLLGGLLAAYFVHRRFGLVDPKPLRWPELSLIALGAVLLASTFTHNWRLDAPGKISPLWLLVSGYVTPMLLFFLVRDARLSERSVVATWAALAVFGAYLAITALAEITQQWWLVFPKYIADPNLGIHFGRARGPMLQSHSLGLYLGICLLCGWAWWRHGRPALKLLLVLFLPLALAALFFTYTRCTWLGAGLAGVAVLGLSVHRSWRPILLGTAVAAATIVAVFFADNIVSIERDAGAAAARDSVSQRASFTYVSWKMFCDRPLWGVGFGQFTDAKLPYLSDRSTPLYLEAIRLQPHHNTFLSLLTETGLVGLIAYLLVLGSWAVCSWQMWRNASASRLVRTQGLLMLGVLCVYLGPAMFFDLAYSPNDHWLVFLLAGLTMGLLPQTQPSEAATRSAVPLDKRRFGNATW